MSRKKIFITLFILLPFVAKSQISTDEKPISFRYDENMFKTRTVKTMPSIDIEALKREDEEKDCDCPPRFGFPHKVYLNLENSGEWFDLPDGKLWKLEISAPGTLSMNLLYDKFYLPEGAKFFVYSADRKQSIGAFTSRNNKFTKDGKIRGFATSFIASDKIILEYYLPKDAKEQGIISICDVVKQLLI